MSIYEQLEHQRDFGHTWGPGIDKEFKTHEVQVFYKDVLQDQDIFEDDEYETYDVDYLIEDAQYLLEDVVEHWDFEKSKLDISKIKILIDGKEMDLRKGCLYD